MIFLMPFFATPNSGVSSCDTCSSPSLTSSVLYWLESAALYDLFGCIQPCLTLPKHCLGSIYSAHYNFVQQTSPQSLSPCLLGKLCTFSTWLNCKCSAPRADRLCNGSMHAAQCALFFLHTGAPEGACTEASLTGPLSCSHISYLNLALRI